jgi:tubulin gamma
MVDQEYDSALDAQTPIIENMVVGVPPVFEGLTRQLDKIVEQPLLGPRSEFPRGRSISLQCLAKQVLMRR